MTHPSIIKAFMVLRKCYPNWSVDPETVAVWDAILADVPPDDVLRAAIEWSRTPSEFPPRPGQIRAMAVKPEEAALSPEEAWGEVMSEIRRVGWNGTPVWSSEAVSRAARALGSWRTLCSQRTDELSANRAHFMRFYGAFSAKAIRGKEQIAMAPILNLMTGKAPMLRSPAEMYGGGEDDPDGSLPASDEKLRRYELGEDL